MVFPARSQGDGLSLVASPMIMTIFYRRVPATIRLYGVNNGGLSKGPVIPDLGICPNILGNGPGPCDLAKWENDHGIWAQAAPTVILAINKIIIKKQEK